MGLSNLDIPRPNGAHQTDDHTDCAIRILGFCQRPGDLTVLQRTSRTGHHHADHSIFREHSTILGDRQFSDASQSLWRQDNR